MDRTRWENSLKPHFFKVNSQEVLICPMLILMRLMLNIFKASSDKKMKKFEIYTKKLKKWKMNAKQWWLVLRFQQGFFLKDSKSLKHQILEKDQLLLKYFQIFEEKMMNLEDSDSLLAKLKIFWILKKIRSLKHVETAKWSIRNLKKLNILWVVYEIQRNARYVGMSFLRTKRKNIWSRLEILDELSTLLKMIKLRIFYLYMNMELMSIVF